jgi:agmatinase
MCDLGDVNHPANPHGSDPANITRTIKAVLGRRAIPLILGGDEGGLAWVLRAYEEFGPIYLVHLDAHIDWRDERGGVKEGFSSGMRRASEMPWIDGMAQVGLRGMGSARQAEVDAALQYGSVFIKASQVHQRGMAACLEMIPRAKRYYISLDTDALDLAVAPGVAYPSPGGLTLDQVSALVGGLARRARIAGFSLFELRPHLDINHLTASTLAQIAINAIGCLAHAGRL